jgi:hypothetical protein
MSSTLAVPSEVFVCNMALSRLGIDQRIASINPPDQSKAAVNCAFWYPACRDKILTDAPWDFARTSTVLAPDTVTTFPGWNYAYQYPSNCLRAVAVMTSHGNRVGVDYWAGWFWPEQFSGNAGFAIPKVPFQVIANSTGTGRTIVTDIPNAYLYFIQATTLTTLFDPLFTDYLAWDLAMELSGPMRVDVKRAELCVKMRKSAMLNTMSSMMNQTQQDPERNAQSVLIR